MTTDVVIATRQQRIVRDETTGRVWLDTLLELDDGTYTLAADAREIVHTAVRLTCWGLTGMFAALTLIQQAAGR